MLTYYKNNSKIRILILETPPIEHPGFCHCLGFIFTFNLILARFLKLLPAHVFFYKIAFDV